MQNTGEEDLPKLLANLQPRLLPGCYVFCSLPGRYGDHAWLTPLATYQEDEGLSMIVPRQQALAAGLSFSAAFAVIDLQVHSSLSAVGLTAAVASRLAAQGISANVVAACFHDHILVPEHLGQMALELLRQVC